MQNQLMKELLEAENDPRFLAYRFGTDDIFMWPFVRYFLFFQIYNRHYDSEEPHQPEKTGFGRWILYLVRSFVKYPCFSKPKDIVFFSSSVVNSHKVKGRYFNRLYDDLWEVDRENSLIIEDAFKRQYRVPRYAEGVKYHDGLFLSVKLLARILGRVDSDDRETINEFVTFLKKKFMDDITATEYATIASTLLTTAKQLPWLKRSYEKFFDRVRPKVVFLEDAFYGQRCYITKWARNAGIKTGELQHGFISSNHLAYNQSSVLFADSDYAAHYPQCFFTFGYFWSQQITLNCQKRVLGFPFIDRMKKDTDLLVEEENKDTLTVLFISDGVLPEETTCFLKELAVLLQGQSYQILLRPHPGEKGSAGSRYEEALQFENVSFDNELNIYKSLRKADFVIGFFSTALYEALAFDRRVILVDHPLSTAHMACEYFVTVKDAQDCLTVMSGLEAFSSRSDSSFFWAADWKGKYKKFLREHGCGIEAALNGSEI